MRVVELLCFPIQPMAHAHLSLTILVQNKEKECLIYNLSEMGDKDAYTVNLSCVRSYVYYHESKYYRKVTEEMLEATNHKWDEAVKWWVSNSARALGKRARGFVFSLKAETYSKSKQGIGYRKVKKLVEWLESRGYIDVYKGYVKTWQVVDGVRQPEEVVPSCMIFRKRTLDLWEGVDSSYNLWTEQENNDLAIVRDRISKETLPNRGRRGMKDIKEEVRTMNTRLEGADITFDGKPIADIAYRRIFTGDLEKGGRLYTLGGGVQLLPQEIRSELLRIDGEPVVELDYSCIHPNICYQMMFNKDGFSVYDVMGHDFSPYDADLSFLSVDQQAKEEWEKLTGRPHNPVRELAKLAILIGMNSNDKNSAAWTLGSKVKQDRAKKKIEEQDFYALTSSSEWASVLEAVQKHNDFIADMFFSDAGIMLQNIDSKIMMRIVGAMGELGHDVLAYHDSVMVKASAEDDLYCAMVDAWRSVLGDTTFCKISKK